MSSVIHRFNRMCHRSFLRSKSSNRRFCSALAQTKESRNEIESKVASYYNENTHYDDVWGDRLHVGFFPHIDDSQSSTEPLSWSDAAVLLTSKMAQWAYIDEKSKVIDFGCGYGIPANDLVNEFKCHVTGIDLAKENIERCNQNFGRDDSPNASNLNFIQGSFTDLPSDLRSSNQHSFSHIFSQLAICHVARHFDQVIQSANFLLKNGGYFVNCDFLKSDCGPTDRVKANFYERLQFDDLISIGEYVSGLTANNFSVINVIDLSSHAEYGYGYVEEQARKTGHDALADKYAQTAIAFREREILMPVIVAQKNWIA